MIVRGGRRLDGPWFNPCYAQVWQGPQMAESVQREWCRLLLDDGERVEPSRVCAIATNGEATSLEPELLTMSP